MKKYIIPFLLLIMVVPFYVNAKTCDTNKITIKSISIEEKSDNVQELEDMTVNGRNINLNIAMLEINDYINYKLVIKNDSNDDYELDKKSFNLNSNYIDYSIISDDNSNLIKANSSKTIFLKIKYKNKVASELFTSGSFKDDKTMKVSLFNEDLLMNPTTGTKTHILIFRILLIISITSFIILKKKKRTTLIILIIGLEIIIPISVNALCKYDITINSNITFYQPYQELCDSGDGLWINGVNYRCGLTEIDDEYIENTRKKYYKKICENEDYIYYEDDSGYPGIKMVSGEIMGVESFIINSDFKKNIKEMYREIASKISLYELKKFFLEYASEDFIMGINKPTKISYIYNGIDYEPINHSSTYISFYSSYHVNKNYPIIGEKLDLAFIGALDAELSISTTDTGAGVLKIENISTDPHTLSVTIDGDYNNPKNDSFTWLGITRNWNYRTVNSFKCIEKGKEYNGFDGLSQYLLDTLEIDVDLSKYDIQIQENGDIYIEVSDSDSNKIHEKISEKWTEVYG